MLINNEVESKGFRRRCITQLLGLWTLSIVLNSKHLENSTFRKLDLFPFSSEGMETPILLGPLEIVQCLTFRGQSTSFVH
jgi:hypothetical protein